MRKRYGPLSLLVLALALPAFGQEPEDVSETSLWTQVVTLYEQAKRAGETASGDVYTWIREDLEHIGDWEYKIESIPAADLEERLNELGGERWEALWLAPAGAKVTVTFKRPSRTWLNKLPLGQLLKMAAPGADSGGD